MKTYKDAIDVLKSHQLPLPHMRMSGDEAAELERTNNLTGKQAGHSRDAAIDHVRNKGVHVRLTVPLHKVDGHFDDINYTPSKNETQRIAKYSQSSDKFPPIRLGFSKRNLKRGKLTAFVHDGNHRTAAARLRGDTHIEAFMPHKDYSVWKQAHQTKL